MERLAKTIAKLKEQLESLRGPEGERLKQEAKEAGKRMGIGGGISFFGAVVMLGAALYFNALLIILFDLFLPLWAAALIIVLGSLFLGGAILAVGASIARKAAKDIPKMGEGVIQQFKESSDELKKTVEEMQEIARKEAEERQRQAQEMLEKAKQAAPYIVAAYVGYRVVKAVVRRRKAKKATRMEAWEED